MICYGIPSAFTIKNIWTYVNNIDIKNEQIKNIIPVSSVIPSQIKICREEHKSKSVINFRRRSMYVYIAYVI